MTTRAVHVAAAAVLLLAGPALAATGPIKTFNSWSLYIHEDGSGKTCFIAAKPAKEEGNYSKRDQPRLFVTRFPVQPPNEQVQVDPGYAFRKDSTVEVKVDDKAFQLFTKGDKAWARSPADDSALIAALRRGKTAVVRGTSTRETFSRDSYALTGFAQAYQAMGEACKNAGKR